MMPGMEENDTRGYLRNQNAEGSGWVTTEVAATALRVTPRTVRAYLEQGKLQGKTEGRGVRKSWLVDIDSLNALRAERLVAEEDPHNLREGSAGEYRGVELADALRTLAERLAERSAEAARLGERLELTAQAESTLRESLERERSRADQERERADQERRERLEAQEEAKRFREELEAERGKGFWQRLFGR
jgi:hypothetical protein